MNLLVITDHLKHSSKDSLYPLLETMAKDHRCNNIDLLSRGNSENVQFFNCEKQEKLYVNKIIGNFKFNESNIFFRNPVETHAELYDTILIRIDRPVSDGLLNHIKLRFRDKIIINDPIGIKTTGSKKFLLDIKDHCPPIELCYTFKSIKKFKRNFPLVLKPLDNYGGNGLVKIIEDEYETDGVVYTESEFEKKFSNEITKGYLAMKYLRNVSQGDKRIIIINEAIVGSILRVPQKGNWLCNLSQGAKSVETTVNEDEREIVNSIAPLMTAHGVVIYGIDTLMEDDGKRVLSEINTLNVGGLIQAQRTSGLSIIRIASKLIWDYIDHKSKIL